MTTPDRTPLPGNPRSASRHDPRGDPRPIAGLRRLALENLGPDRARPTWSWSFLMVWLALLALVGWPIMLSEVTPRADMWVALWLPLPLFLGAVGSLGRRRVLPHLTPPSKWLARVTKLIGFCALGALPLAVHAASPLFGSVIAALLLLCVLPWFRVAGAALPWFALAPAPLVLTALLVASVVTGPTDSAPKLTIDLLTLLAFAGFSLFWLIYFPLELRAWQRMIESERAAGMRRPS